MALRHEGQLLKFQADAVETLDSPPLGNLHYLNFLNKETVKITPKTKNCQGLVIEPTDSCGTLIEVRFETDQHFVRHTL